MAEVPLPTPTQAPVPSTDIRNAVFAGAKLDEEVTGSGEFYTDRLGIKRLTNTGRNNQFNAAQQERADQFQQFLLSSGYVFLGDYEDGPFQFSARNQYIRYNDQYYRLNATTDVGFTTTGTDATSFANDVTHFVLMDGDTLRQNLGSDEGADLVGWKGSTVGEVLDRIDIDASVKNNPLALLLQTGGLIQFGIDSLCEGAGNTNFIRYLKILLHSSFNYGGPGFYVFDQASFQIEGDQSFYATGSYTSMRNLAMDAYPAKYAPAGRGLYWSAATGTEQCGGDPKLPWDKCNFYYLKKPGAGGFTVTAGGVETIVSCDGDLDLGVVQLSRDATNASSVTVTGITGEVVIFGADFIYSPNARGIRTATISRGGRKLSEFVTQDAAFVAKWKLALNPKLVVVNAGTNDLGQGRTLAQFSADMDTYLSQVVPSGSAVLIVEPTETSKTSDPAYASIVEEFRVYRRDYAIANGYYYLDDRLTLGSYSVATSKGWMNDETHPNVTGNKLRASAMACLMGANTVVPAEFKYAPRIINTGSMGKITADFPPVASGAGVNNSKTLWTFGIVGGYNAAIVNVTAFLRTRTTQKYSRIRAVVLISNGTASDNWATGARILSHEWDNWDAETTSTPSITAAINANNLVEISIAAAGNYGFYCSAKATMDLIEAPKNHAQSLWLASSTESLLFNFTVTS